MSGQRVNKKELAYMKAMVDIGHTPTKVAKSIGRSHHTVIDHLQKSCNDPEVKEMVELIKQSELQELTTIGLKSRTILNNYLDSVLSGEKEPNPISITAILDRTFQQRQLLENKPTQIVDIVQIDKEIKELELKIRLEAEHKVRLELEGKATDEAEEVAED